MIMASKNESAETESEKPKTTTSGNKPLLLQEASDRRADTVATHPTSFFPQSHSAGQLPGPLRLGNCFGADVPATWRSGTRSASFR